MSFVVRDPLPMIDEILIGFGAALVVWLLIGKRFLSSRAAEEKRNELYTGLDAVAFDESAFVRKIEETLEAFDAAGREKLLRIYNAASGRAEASGEEGSSRMGILPEWEDEADALDECLDELFSARATKDFGKRFRKKTGAGPEADKTLAALNKLISATRIDFSLFVLHTVLRRSLEG